MSVLRRKEGAKGGRAVTCDEVIRSRNGQLRRLVEALLAALLLTRPIPAEPLAVQAHLSFGWFFRPLVVYVTESWLRSAKPGGLRISERFFFLSLLLFPTSPSAWLFFCQPSVCRR